MASDHAFNFGDHEIGARDWGGDGTALVLLPGGGRNLTDWELVVPALQDKHRVVGIDPPGHGASSEPDRWDWEVSVGFVDQAIAELDLDNPFVCGHSMGGMIAVRYGRDHPDARGVVNVDGHGLGGPSVPREFHEARRRMIAEAPPPPPDSGDDDWLAAVLDASRASVAALGIAWEDAEPALRRNFARRSDGTWARKPSRRFVETLPEMGPELFDIYRSVKCPLLIFNCTSPSGQPFDPELAKAYRNALAADLDTLRADRPLAEVATIDSGHSVHLEHPHETARLILDFTSRHA